MFDYFRIACAVPDVEVADVEYNIDKMAKFIGEAKNKNVDLLVFPELGITGYTCSDLFFQQTLINASNSGIKKLTEKSDGIIIAAGAPVAIDGCLYNCAVIISDGRIIGIIPKTFIPNHGEQSEKRWFDSAANLNKAFIAMFYCTFVKNNTDISIIRIYYPKTP